jgi:hypothetical protein
MLIYGNTTDSGALLTSIPQPSSIALLIDCSAILAIHRSQSMSCASSQLTHCEVIFFAARRDYCGDGPG